jgi:hypothetical protein
MGICNYVVIIYFSQGLSLLLAKKRKSKIGQRKFELDWEQIGDIYVGICS